ncbi:MAG: MarR family winged helix-turn-helix transcriptional regulator [Chloroflexota bacterium]|nr:MarR family winged helix-turn-helix transcriptional regulator [Acidimicrobiia bacterium]MDH3396282.1 MarR family winged helix-turn-helix transcriptional regulator [Acidimicrobiia bacterium]MDH4335135.1 MarR family winged helix-turn-helix transcriptional regulator [Chloroflexota bacterium]
MNDSAPRASSLEPSQVGVTVDRDGTKYLRPEYARAFLGLIRASDSVFRALDRSLQDGHRISLHEYEVLLFLAVFSPDHSMPMTELRRRTPLSQSRVSRVVSGLEDGGLVRRSTDDADKRSVTVTLTAQGLEKYRSAQDRHLQDLDEHLFSVLTEREINQLAAITAKILAANHTPGGTGAAPLLLPDISQS